MAIKEGFEKKLSGRAAQIAKRLDLGKRQSVTEVKPVSTMPNFSLGGNTTMYAVAAAVLAGGVWYFKFRKPSGGGMGCACGY